MVFMLLHCDILHIGKSNGCVHVYTYACVVLGLDM